jgi:hypothetical protein
LRIGQAACEGLGNLPEDADGPLQSRGRLMPS